MFAIVAQNLIGLCALIAVGLAAGKIGVIDEGVSKGLGDVLLKIALPCTIIMSMQRPFSAELFKGGALTLALSAAVYIVSLGVGQLACVIFGVKPRESWVWLFAAAFPNVGYMGFPVLGAVFGDAAMFYVSMNNAAFNAFSSTIGLSIIGGGWAALKKGFGGRGKKPLRDWNILPFVTALGFALFVLSVKIPAPLAKGLTMASNMTTPLSMLIIGALLSRGGGLFKGAKELGLIAVRLVVLPLIIYCALAPWLKDPYILGTLVLLTGMPAAAVTVIYASAATDQGALASRIVAASTVLSLITLPLIALLI